MNYRLVVFCGMLSMSGVAGPWDPVPMQAPGTTGAPAMMVPGLMQQPPTPVDGNTIESRPVESGAPVGVPVVPNYVPQVRSSTVGWSPAGASRGAAQTLEPILPAPQPRARVIAMPKPPQPAQLVGIAPARLVFSVDKNGRSSKPQTIALWSEKEPLAQFVISAGAPWLIVQAKKVKEQRRPFEVTVRPDGLAPGTHSTAITVAAEGKPVMTIPVTVEVVGKF